MSLRAAWTARAAHAHWLQAKQKMASAGGGEEKKSADKNHANLTAVANDRKERLFIFPFDIQQLGIRGNGSISRPSAGPHLQGWGSIFMASGLSRARKVVVYSTCIVRP